MTRQAKFRRFDECTAEDAEIFGEEFVKYEAGLPDRLIAHLKLLDGEFGGFNINRLEHCLQTATRAFRDERSEEYVVCCLLHDIGDILAPANHPGLAAAILKPYVSEANLFMVEEHAPFQGFYYYDKQGRNNQERGKHNKSPHFEYAKEYMELYDMPSFDETYDNMTLEDFAPLIGRVMCAERREYYQSKRNENAKNIQSSDR
jgi:predicted HD phosphohydrolase